MAPALQIDRMSPQGWDRDERTAVGRMDTIGIRRAALYVLNTLSVARRRRVCSVEGLSCMASAVSQLDVSDRAAYGAEGAATRRLCEERGARPRSHRPRRPHAQLPPTRVASRAPRAVAIIGPRSRSP